MKKIGLLFGFVIFLTGCTGAIKCRMTSFDGIKVHRTKWHHGVDACMEGVKVLPELQAHSELQLWFQVRGSKKARAEFQKKVLGDQPAPSGNEVNKGWDGFKTVAMEVKNRG